MSYLPTRIEFAELDATAAQKAAWIAAAEADGDWWYDPLVRPMIAREVSAEVVLAALAAAEVPK